MRSDWVVVVAVLVGLVLVFAVLVRLVVLVLADRRPSPWGASAGPLAARETGCSPAGPRDPGRMPASGHGTADAGTRGGATRAAGPGTGDVGAEDRRVARDVVELRRSPSSATAPGQDDGPVLGDIDSRLDAVFEAADLRWPH